MTNVVDIHSKKMVSAINMLNSTYLLFLAVLYVTISLTALAVAFRFVNIIHLSVSGATILFGFNFIILDIITDVYGYSISRKVIWVGFFSELFFSIIINFINCFPYPSFFHNQESYNLVFGRLPHFFLSAFIADFAGMFIASYLMSKWKIIARGRYFWLRSFLTLAAADFIMTIIIVIGAFHKNVPDLSLVGILISGYMLHVLYTSILIWPAFALTSFIKKKEKIDIFDINVNYNPFKFLSNKNVDTGEKYASETT